jgi:4,5-dihydroxyphthalate decarboxylase
MSGAAPLELSLAISDADHTRDVRLGRVAIEGVQLRCSTLPVEEIFFRQARHSEWDVSEFSLGKYVTLLDHADEPPIGLPVFPSRMFRHSAVFVRDDSALESLADLRGKRVGIPEWTITATVWARGLLTHEYGIALDEITWVQAGTNQAGRIEGIAFEPPVDLERITDASLDTLLTEGRIDAAIAPHPPRGFTSRPPVLRRLLRDYETEERLYFESTGVFPIMHLIVIRHSVFEQHRWLAMELMKAFENARDRSIARLADPNWSYLPAPWTTSYVERVRSVMGAEIWPYGIEPNRTTLAAFLQFSHEQGLTGRRLSPDELFPDEVRERYVV